jgi:hypothetical protein
MEKAGEKIPVREAVLSSGEYFSLKPVRWIDLLKVDMSNSQAGLTQLAFIRGTIDGKNLSDKDLERPVCDALRIIQLTGQWYVEDMSGQNQSIRDAAALRSCLSKAQKSGQ